MRFGAPAKRAKGALILLHGRGSNAADIAGLADVLNVAEYACVAPSATGGAWYPHRFFAPLQQNEPWLGSALQTVDALSNELMQDGIPPERIGLLGFSQGACLALEHAARVRRPYAFVAALSGALIGALDTPRAPGDLKRLPVLIGCAEADAHIPLPYVEKSASTLEALNAHVTKQIYPGAAHTVFGPEIDWINQRLK